MKKPVFVLSAILSTFILLTVAGVVYSLRHTVPAEAAAEPTVTASPTATDGPDFVQILAEREAAYRSLIDAANARLDQAQGEIQRLQARLDAAQVASVAPETPTPLVTIEQAAQIAADYLGQSQVFSAESVMDGDNLTAYKVIFSSGDVVFVSAAGEIISTQPAPQAPAPSASKGGRGEHEEHEEHEGHEEHEDDD